MAVEPRDTEASAQDDVWLRHVYGLSEVFQLVLLTLYALAAVSLHGLFIVFQLILLTLYALVGLHLDALANDDESRKPLRQCDACAANGVGTAGETLAFVLDATFCTVNDRVVVTLDEA